MDLNCAYLVPVRDYDGQLSRTDLKNLLPNVKFVCINILLDENFAHKLPALAFEEVRSQLECQLRANPLLSSTTVIRINFECKVSKERLFETTKCINILVYDPIRDNIKLLTEERIKCKLTNDLNSQPLFDFFTFH